MILKPKKDKIHVPGIGVVSKDDFDEVHLGLLKEHILAVSKTTEGKEVGLTVDSYLKRNFEIVSFGENEEHVSTVYDETEPQKKTRKRKSEENTENESE